MVSGPIPTRNPTSKYRELGRFLKGRLVHEGEMALQVRVTDHAIEGDGAELIQRVQRGHVPRLLGVKGAALIAVHSTKAVKDHLFAAFRQLAAMIANQSEATSGKIGQVVTLAQRGLA